MLYTLYTCALIAPVKVHLELMQETAVFITITSLAVTTITQFLCYCKPEFSSIIYIYGSVKVINKENILRSHATVLIFTLTYRYLHDRLK